MAIKVQGTTVVDDSRNITNVIDSNSSGITTASRFVSTQTTGTAPLTVTSTTLVSNLNADLLDGQEGSYYRNASNINAGTIDDAYLPATISSDITGNAATATTATTATTARVSTNGTNNAFKVPFANTTANTTGDYGLLQDSGGTFTYNPSTDTLTVGNVTGTATTATTARVSTNGTNNAFKVTFANTTGNTPGDYGLYRTMHQRSLIIHLLTH